MGAYAVNRQPKKVSRPMGGHSDTVTERERERERDRQTERERERERERELRRVSSVFVCLLTFFHSRPWHTHSHTHTYTHAYSLSV
jgi:hypothetical protein